MVYLDNIQGVPDFDTVTLGFCTEQINKQKKLNKHYFLKLPFSRYSQFCVFLKYSTKHTYSLMAEPKLLNLLVINRKLMDEHFIINVFFF